METSAFIKSTIGRCQLCGAAVSNGVDECVDTFSAVCEKEYKNANYTKMHKVTVDAHALQHPELHGPLSSYYHLLSLHSIVTRNAPTGLGAHDTYLQDLMQIRHQLPTLTPPEPLARGALSIYDVFSVHTADEHIYKVEAWGQEVWKAWNTHHDWAETMLRSLSTT